MGEGDGCFDSVVQAEEGHWAANCPLTAKVLRSMQSALNKRASGWSLEFLQRWRPWPQEKSSA